ncbi:MAG: peroxiredoxin family protein [Phycisphaeraceae bacterium]|nr:peroxiredoxin family protein [Phycisphaeraceae bacterium]
MYCRNQLGGLESRRPEFERRGATLVAVSSDPLSKGQEFVEDDEVGFPILSDTGGATIRAWGLSEKGETRSVPAIFVVDRLGVIRFARVGESISDRPQADEILDALDRL